MSDMRPDRDDAIHRLFRHLRSGFSDIVVNLVDRVDKRLEIFIDDERHTSPDIDELAVDAFGDAASVFSSAITTQLSQPDASDVADDNHTDEDGDIESPSSTEPDED